MRGRNAAFRAEDRVAVAVLPLSGTGMSRSKHDDEWIG
jgi:hypothetical protein